MINYQKLAIFHKNNTRTALNLTHPIDLSRLDRAFVHGTACTSPDGGVLN